MIIFFAVELLVLSALLALFGLLSLKEQERRASGRAFSAAMLLVFFNLVVSRNDFLFLYAGILGNCLLLAGVLIFLLPIGKRSEQIQTPRCRVDERDIPFARHHLQPGTPEYESYYNLRPENRQIDDRVRALPGLLSPQARLAHEPGFAAARASFEFIETFREAVEPPPTAAPYKLPRRGREKFIKALTLHYGAHSVGITNLQDYHLYSHVGRGTGTYGEPIQLAHKTAIAFTVEMAFHMVRPAPQASVVMESARQYVEAARIAMQLAFFLRNAGYSARAHIDSNYRVIAPLVARDAGLGEIGRMGLLMTPDLGPRVRIGVVTTDLELKADSYQPDASIIDFCLICKKCAENCPSRAIPFGDREEINGALRWQINWNTCFHYWNVIGTDCCRCMAVCPYSHPNTSLHRLVRWGNRHSGGFRRAALFLDDFFYGRKPEALPLPKWLQSFH